MSESRLCFKTREKLGIFVGEKLNRRAHVSSLRRIHFLTAGKTEIGAKRKNCLALHAGFQMGEAALGLRLSAAEAEFVGQSQLRPTGGALRRGLI